jgi:hypothetical protein
LNNGLLLRTNVCTRRNRTCDPERGFRVLTRSGRLSRASWFLRQARNRGYQDCSEYPAHQSDERKYETLPTGEALAVGIVEKVGKFLVDLDHRQEPGEAVRRRQAVCAAALAATVPSPGSDRSSGPLPAFPCAPTLAWPFALTPPDTHSDRECLAAHEFACPSPSERAQPLLHLGQAAPSRAAEALSTAPFATRMTRSGRAARATEGSRDEF